MLEKCIQTLKAARRKMRLSFSRCCVTSLLLSVFLTQHETSCRWADIHDFMLNFFSSVYVLRSACMRIVINIISEKKLYKNWANRRRLNFIFYIWMGLHQNESNLQIILACCVHLPITLIRFIDFFVSLRNLHVYYCYFFQPPVLLYFNKNCCFHTYKNILNMFDNKINT